MYSNRLYLENFAFSCKTTSLQTASEIVVLNAFYAQKNNCFSDFQNFLRRFVRN